MGKTNRRKKDLLGRKIAGVIEDIANSDAFKEEDPELHLELNKAVALAKKAKRKIH